MPSTDPPGMSAGAPWARRATRVLGALLLVLTLTPVYRVLDTPETGSFGVGTIIRGSGSLEGAWWGMAAALVLGLALAILVPAGPVRARLARAGAALARAPVGRFALGAGAVSAGLAVLVGQMVFRRYPTLVDEMSTLLHARFLAAGRLALPLPRPWAAWMIPNTLVTPEGWVSQYPPFHPLLLAAGYLAGAPWLVGPLLLGATVAFSVLVADHLLPRERATTRLAGVLLAASPFLLFIGSGYLSHVPAAAFGALTLYAALRARDGHWAWAVVVGLGSGAMVTTRPWTGLVLAVAFPAVLWLHRAWASAGWRWTLPRIAGAAAGGLPLALGLAWYDRRLFGAPLTLGYALAYGSSHGLGFHRDPWGNLYGPLEALGYSAANLLTLGVYLLETAVPALAVVGLLLLLLPRRAAGTGVLVAWALLPVGANFFYWHHGFHLGPRMLYEAAPAWILLATVAAVRLVSREQTPAGAESAAGAGDEGGQPAAGSFAGRLRTRVPPRDLLLWMLLVSLVSLPLLFRLRADAYGWAEETLRRIAPPDVPPGEPALVFVHGSWAERITGRLQGAGMRLDSIETALRRNDVCLLHAYTTDRLARAAGGPVAEPLPALDFELLPGAPGHLRAVTLAEGERVGLDPTRPLTPPCRREAAADRNGIVSLAPLVWQGDLPGIESGAPMFVRDLGPEENAVLLRALPGRRPYVLYVPVPGRDPVLVEYDRGMVAIWQDDGASPPAAEDGTTPAGTGPG